MSDCHRKHRITQKIIKHPVQYFLLFHLPQSDMYVIVVHLEQRLKKKFSKQLFFGLSKKGCKRTTRLMTLLIAFMMNVSCYLRGDVIEPVNIKLVAAGSLSPNVHQYLKKMYYCVFIPCFYLRWCLLFLFFLVHALLLL